MATLRVYYTGLIAHISKTDHPKEKDFAAIVKNSHHLPFFAAQTDANLPFFDILRRIGPEVREITCEDVNKAETDKLFDSYVPSLKTILGGKLGAALEDKTVKLGYPAADNDHAVLSVAQLYQKLALYQNKIKPHLMCVARITVATLKTAAPKVIFRALGANGVLWTETISLEADKCVLIGNVAKNFAWTAAKTLSQMHFSTAEVGSHGDQPEHEHHASTPASQEDDKAAHDDHALQNGVEHGSSSHGGPGGHVAIYGEILDDDAANDLVLTEIDGCKEKVAFPGCSWLSSLAETLRAEQKPQSGDRVECGNTTWP